MHANAIAARAAELDRYMTLFARRTLHRDKAVHRDHGRLTRHEFRVIHALGERRAWTMGELARELACSLSSLTALTDRLEAKRLVERRRSDRDRRAVHVRLTSEGRSHFTRMRRMHLLFCRRMLAALAPSEQSIFLGLMRKIAGPAAESQP